MSRLFLNRNKGLNRYRHQKMANGRPRTLLYSRENEDTVRCKQYLYFLLLIIRAVFAIQYEATLSSISIE